MMVSFSAERAASTLWRVEGATVLSTLNEPYVIRVDVQSDSPDAEPLDMLGSPAELVLRHESSENTYGGIVSSVRAMHHHGMETRASLTVEPALAALRHTRDTRIFQELSVPEILAQVLAAHLAPYGRSARQALQRAYPKREYTVQYQESHFDFVHRLMEEEGIVYYFEQDGPVEVMVLVDVAQAHPSLGLLDYSSTVGDAGLQEREYVRSFEPLSTVVGSEVTTRHFDWTRPGVMITARADGLAGPGDGPDGSSVGPVREAYQHDESLTLHSYAQAYRGHDAADQARLRRESQLRDSRRHQACSTYTALRAGARVELHQHPTVTLNASYNIIGVQHFAGSHAVAGGAEAQQVYVNRFTAVPAEVLYRPRRTRPRPRVHGIQTAIVTGPAGEEIHTDEHGRVKVQFHWDRLGRLDDRTTCWLRCMQTSAGAGFGAFVLPRVGMEVVVAFIDGDPDRPLVTGTVYNGANPGPYPMPEKKMLTVFKSNSYPGGGGFNELRLDDTKDAEEIWLHGQKDWNTLILNDLNRDVLRDETQNVTRNRTRTVGVDESVSVGSTQTVQVGTIRSVTVGAAQNHTIGGVDTTMIGASKILAVVGDHTEQVGVTRRMHAGERIELAVGDSSIVLTPDAIYLKSTAIHMVTEADIHADSVGNIFLNSGTAQPPPPDRPTTPAGETE